MRETQLKTVKNTKLKLTLIIFLIYNPHPISCLLLLRPLWPPRLRNLALAVSMPSLIYSLIELHGNGLQSTHQNVSLKLVQC